MAAVLTNGKGFYDPLVYVLESYRFELKFLPPSVNEPGPAFVVAGNAIRVPLIRAKGLTDRTTKRLLAERERGAFNSLADFQARVRPAPEELEILIRAGGFDEFGQARTRQFWEAQHLHKSAGRSDHLEFDFEAGANPCQISSYRIHPCCASRRDTSSLRPRGNCLATPSAVLRWNCLPTSPGTLTARSPPPTSS
jgi:DNA polymerase III alpha subunit